MRKILIISTVGLIYDGITNVILSYLQAMDLSNMEIYIGATINVVPEIRSKLEKMGCQIIELPSRRDKPLKYMFELVKMIRINKIQVIHAHGNSGTLAIEMVAAWLGGCRKRIAHSHNTQCDQVRADKLLRPIFNMFYTDALACGEDAGKWLFGKNPFKVLKNGRDLEVYAFNKEMRNQVRNEFKLENRLTIGHCGGFYEQKNHIFLSEIYHELVRIQPDIKLFMIGDGPLKHEIECLCGDIKDNVVFTGNTSRVSELLQAMDGMLLPSLFEGLPLVVIEWQINGLPCILSTNISRECDISNLVHFLPVDNNASAWAIEIVKYAKENKRMQSSKEASEKIRLNGFNIHDEAKKLRMIYMK